MRIPSRLKPQSRAESITSHKQPSKHWSFRRESNETCHGISGRVIAFRSHAGQKVAESFDFRLSGEYGVRCLSSLKSLVTHG